VSQPKEEIFSNNIKQTTPSDFKSKKNH